MSRIKSAVFALLLAVSSPLALAASASHVAEAERFLKLVNANQLTTPVYLQVQYMFQQRFEELKAPQNKVTVLERYTARANASLDKVIGWDKLKPELVNMYTSNFTEAELKGLIEFYQSPLGRKVLERMPVLTAQSAELAQSKLEPAVPQVNKLLEDMSKELGKR